MYEANRILKVSGNNAKWNFVWEQWSEDNGCYEKRSLEVPQEYVDLNSLFPLLQGAGEAASEFCERSLFGTVESVVFSFNELEDMSAKIKFIVDLSTGDGWNITTPKRQVTIGGSGISKTNEKISYAIMKENAEKLIELQRGCLKFLGLIE